MNNVLGRPFRKGGSFNRQRGGVAITVAVTLTGLIAMMGLAVDTGNVLSQRDHLQHMANAAALSAAKSLYFPNESFRNPGNDARQTIRDMNGGTLDGLTVEIGSLPSATDMSGKVDVAISKTVAPVLLGIVGVGDTTLSAVAAAGPAPESAYSVAPIMACTNSFDDPGIAETNNPVIYRFLESFRSDTSLPNAVGFRMFIDTAGFDEQILNEMLLYEITSVMLGSGENVHIYEDTPTRVVDEFGYDSVSLRPGTLMNTRLGLDGWGGNNSDYFPADINSRYARDNETVCTDCGSYERYTDQFIAQTNNDGRVTEFINERIILPDQYRNPSQYPYKYRDYLADLEAGNNACPGGGCKPGRRILKMPVAPNCGVSDLQQKQFACFFMLEPANVFLNDVIDGRGIDLEWRTEFIAQHIPCPDVTTEEKVRGAFDVVLYEVGV